MNQERFEKLLMQTFVFNGTVWKQSQNLRKEKYVVITRVFQEVGHTILFYVGNN